jgi:hypothetical protein
MELEGFQRRKFGRFWIQSVLKAAKPRYIKLRSNFMECNETMVEGIGKLSAEKIREVLDSEYV